MATKEIFNKTSKKKQRVPSRLLKKLEGKRAMENKKVAAELLKVASLLSAVDVEKIRKDAMKNYQNALQNAVRAINKYDLHRTGLELELAKRYFRKGGMVFDIPAQETLRLVEKAMASLKKARGFKSKLDAEISNTRDSTQRAML